MSEPEVSTVLVPERQSLLPALGCSLIFHLGAAVSAWGLTAVYGLIALVVPFCSPREPIVQESIEVSMVALPKSKLNVPDRAARVKRATGTDAAPQPEPPPVKQSDLAKFEKTPPPKPGNTAADRARQELLEQLMREEMLADLDAPEGTVDRNATDPNGAEDLGLAVIGAGAKGDPEYARWVAQVQQLLMKHFRPLAAVTQGRTDLKCMVTLEVDPATGQILSWEVSQPSGVTAFDSAAERAVQEVATLPLPPEKYRPLLAQGVGFRFVPP